MIVEFATVTSRATVRSVSRALQCPRATASWGVRCSLHAERDPDVMMTDDDVATLIDFGTASEAKVDMASGNPGAQPPEVQSNAPDQVCMWWAPPLHRVDTTQGVLVVQVVFDIAVPLDSHVADV